MADLASLRATVQELQSFSLPSNYETNEDTSTSDDANGRASSNNNNNNNPALLFSSPQLLSRYKSSRNAYLQNRTLELFIQTLATYDPTTRTFSMPTNNDDDEEEQKKHAESVLNEIKNTLESVNEGVDSVRVKYAGFKEKREELADILEGMERAERQRALVDANLDEDEDDDDGVEITEEEVAAQEEELESLQQRRQDLEAKLRMVRGQILDVEDDIHGVKQVVNEVRVRMGRKQLDWRRDAASTVGSGEEDGVEYFSVVNDVECEIAEMEEKAMELQQSKEFYDGMRELMEELGGVKIMSTKSTSSPDVQGESNTEEQQQQAEKRQKLHNEEDFVLTLMLLGSHILELVIKTVQLNEDKPKNGLRVMTAKLTTPTTFPVPQSNTTTNENDTSLVETMHSISLSNISFSKIMSQKQTVSIAIPPLDDLVQWSHSLDSSQGIRFILVETMARIRTLEARVLELTHLRENYAAQIYDIEECAVDAQFGGAEQEVVCAINEGISVALRLGADCPLVSGSVYISELFGVGGWEEEKLDELKALVVERRCKGPVEVMELIVKSIRKKREEEGWKVPLTPRLPLGMF